MGQRRLTWMGLVLASLASASSHAQAARAADEDTVTTAPQRPAESNSDIYYRNKLEYSEEVGMLPFNIPFVFDIFVGDDYTQKPLHYTMVPAFQSLRWHMGKLSGPSLLRGNMDMTATLSYTGIPRGPESKYGAFDLGFRRNFVHGEWRASPYFEARAGAGYIDARGPYGVRWGQGQNFTFTLMMGSGVRYNFSSKYSMSVGCSYMHVSNAYLSLPKHDDNGINVYGPWLGFNVSIGKPKSSASLRR